MECHQSQVLIPSYLDGELSEAQAAPLRRHLLDCQACRAGAQGEKNQKRWFSVRAQVSVPQGFAARVARRAFAGDTGQADFEIMPAGAAGVFARSPSSNEDFGRDGSEDHHLRFVLQATAAAALLVLALSVALRSLSLPAGTSLRAADGRNEISVEKALERLDQMNQIDRAKAGTPPAPKATETSGDTTRTIEVHRP